jgi:hypothetical protein
MRTRIGGIPLLLPLFLFVLPRAAAAGVLDGEEDMSSSYNDNNPELYLDRSSEPDRSSKRPEAKLTEEADVRVCKGLVRDVKPHFVQSMSREGTVTTSITGADFRVEGCGQTFAVGGQNAVQWGLVGTREFIPGTGLMQVQGIGDGNVARLRVRDGTVLSVEWLKSEPSPRDLASPPSQPDAAVVSTSRPLVSQARTEDLRVDPSRGNVQRATAIVFEVVGLAGLIAGAVLGIEAKAKEKQSENFCEPKNPSVCSHRGVQLIDEAQRFATAANACLLGGGIAFVGGLVLHIAAPSASASVAQAEYPKGTQRWHQARLRTSVTLSFEGRF